MRSPSAERCALISRLARDSSLILGGRRRANFQLPSITIELGVKAHLSAEGDRITVGTSARANPLAQPCARTNASSSLRRVGLPSCASKPSPLAMVVPSAASNPALAMVLAQLHGE